MDDGLTERAESLLDSEPLVGHLATCLDGQRHAVPLWYALHGRARNLIDDPDVEGLVSYNRLAVE